MTGVAGASAAPTARRGERLRRLRRDLRADAQEKWTVHPRAAEILFILPIALSLLVALAMLRRGFFLLLTGEDSLVEWLQVAGFAAAGIVSALLVGRRLHAGDRRRALPFAVLAGACLFVAGEEISWGQRMLGFETPEPLGAVNRQEEFTLHNIDAVRVALKFGAILVGLAGAVLPWVARRRKWTRTRFVPPLFVSSAFAVLFAYNVVRLAAYPDNFFYGSLNIPEVFVAYSEWTELVLAYITLVIVWLAWRGGRASAGATPAAPVKR